MRRVALLLLALLVLDASIGVSVFAVAGSSDSENPWVTLQPLPAAGTNFKAGVVGDKIYLINLDLNYQYSNNVWRTKQPLPPPRRLCLGFTTTKSTASAAEQITP